MKRKIIEIDEELCNGCGACVPNCPEGALQIVDGKARMVGASLCDGLGACIGECPQDAIRIIEKEAEPYDEKKAVLNIAQKGEGAIRAHLEHLKSHGEFDLYNIAVASLKEHGIPVPALADPAAKPLPCGCPGRLAKILKKEPAAEKSSGAAVRNPSELRQWPVQLELQNPDAPYFDHADLLIAADCAAYADANFHAEFIKGKILIILCPKLAADTGKYVERLAQIFRNHAIHSITVARMEVPCCGGIVEIVRKALETAGRNQEIKIHIINI